MGKLNEYLVMLDDGDEMIIKAKHYTVEYKYITFWLEDKAIWTTTKIESVRFFEDA